MAAWPAVLAVRIAVSPFSLRSSALAPACRCSPCARAADAPCRVRPVSQHPKEGYIHDRRAGRRWHRAAAAPSPRAAAQQSPPRAATRPRSQLAHRCARPDVATR
eukprot:scaffold127404_cov75-Phaeocystis_antarctica.AAC.2